MNGFGKSVSVSMPGDVGGDGWNYAVAFFPVGQDADVAAAQVEEVTRPQADGKCGPNIGLPLFDCVSVASS